MTDDEMATLYSKGLSTAQISVSAGCAQGTVWRRLTNTGLVLRSNSESVHLRKGHGPLIMTDELLSLFDGLLLGDGTMERCAISARFSLSQTGPRIAWAEYIHQYLAEHGVNNRKSYTQGGRVIIKGKFCNRQNKCQIRTAYFKELLLLWERWYSSGTKRVPKDIVLDAKSIAQWYMGDGTVGGKGYRVYFCTDGFPPEDVQMLADLLSLKYGWHIAVEKKRNRLLMCRAADRNDFVQLLRNEIHSHFDYKLELKTTDRRFKQKVQNYCGFEGCTVSVSKSGRFCRSCAATHRWRCNAAARVP